MYFPRIFLSESDGRTILEILRVVLIRRLKKIENRGQKWTSEEKTLWQHGERYYESICDVSVQYSSLKILRYFAQSRSSAYLTTDVPPLRRGSQMHVQCGGTASALLSNVSNFASPLYSPVTIFCNRTFLISSPSPAPSSSFAIHKFNFRGCWFKRNSGVAWEWGLIWSRVLSHINLSIGWWETPRPVIHTVQ